MLVECRWNGIGLESRLWLERGLTIVGRINWLRREIICVIGDVEMIAPAWRFSK